MHISIHGDTTRAFIAAQPDQRCREFLSAQQQSLSSQIREPDIRWAPADNYHITLKFLGQMHLSNMDHLADCLKSIAQDSPPFSVVIRSACNFPNSQSGRCIACPVDDTPELTQLVSKIEDGAHALGFAAESKPFRGHMTLGRRITNKTPMQLENADEYCAMEITSLVVMQSLQSPNGSRYEVVHKIPLS